jgi:hypothetical protein
MGGRVRRRSASGDVGLSAVRGEAADLEQVESEFFDPGQHAVQRRLVGNRASQQRVAALGLGVQCGECAQRRRTQVAADTDLVARRESPGGVTPTHPGGREARCYRPHHGRRASRRPTPEGMS